MRIVQGYKFMNKLSLKIFLMFVVMNMFACSDYEPEFQPDETVIPDNTPTYVTLNNDIQLIPNQEADINLSVTKIGLLKVTDVVASAKVNIDMGKARANIRINSIIFEENANKNVRRIDGYVVNNDDGQTGIAVGCGKADIKECGVLKFQNTHDWKFLTKGIIDIGNMSIMVDRSKN